MPEYSPSSGDESSSDGDAGSEPSAVPAYDDELDASLPEGSAKGAMHASKACTWGQSMQLLMGV